MKDIKLILVTILVIILACVIMFFVFTSCTSSESSWANEYLVEYDESEIMVNRDLRISYDEGVGLITNIDGKGSEVIDGKVYFCTNPDDELRSDIIAHDLETRKNTVFLEKIGFRKISIENGNLIYVSKDSKTITIYDIRTGEEKSITDQSFTLVNLSAFTEKKLFFKNGLSTNWLWDIESGKKVILPLEGYIINNDCVSDEYILLVKGREEPYRLDLFNMKTEEMKLISHGAKDRGIVYENDYVFWVDDNPESKIKAGNSLYCYKISTDEIVKVNRDSMNVVPIYLVENNTVYYVVNKSSKPKNNDLIKNYNFGYDGIIIKAEFDDLNIVSRKSISSEYHEVIFMDICENWLYIVTNRGGDPEIFGAELYSISDDYLIRKRDLEHTENSIHLLFMNIHYGDENRFLVIKSEVFGSKKAFGLITFRKEYFDDFLKRIGEKRN